MKKYETFDHTADLGIRVFGRSCEEIFANAAYALFDQLTDLKRVREKTTLEIPARGADREELLVHWLSELLFLWESKGYLFKNFSFPHFDQTSLKAVGRGEIFDPSRHKIKVEIKAVTYHQVQVREIDGSWEGKVILDI